MKQLIFILALLIFGQTFAQTDKNGNPIFNSVTVNEKPVEDCLLTSNYYTLKNNIENKGSSVFISEYPTLDEVELAAINLPSDFFSITKESKMVVLILLQNYPKREFLSIEMQSRKQSTHVCTLSGDITENRANEIIKVKYDTTATISEGVLKFNKKEFKIVSNKAIEEAVLALINKEKFTQKEPSDVVSRSQKEIRAFILTESKEGGKLDFFTEIKGKEYDGVQTQPGVFTTKGSIALYKWGRACYEIGVNTVDDALAIFAEHKGRALNPREKENISQGFNKEWEK